MLRSLKSLHFFRLAARDGEIGTVHDFLFDDEFWTIRYLVADTGRWLPGRKVLLAPETLGQPVWAASEVPVGLSREQVESSPDIDTAKPVSRQRQIELHRHYGWPFYWAGGGVWPNPVAPLPPRSGGVPPEQADGSDEADPHLRSMREVIGYHIQASDGRIGHVEDLIADDRAWEIRYLVVDTRNWLPGRKVLVAPQWFAGPVSWAEHNVTVFMTREQVKSSPEFDPAAPVNREYEVGLYDYYGRPGYWMKKPETAAKK